MSHNYLKMFTKIIVAKYFLRIAISAPSGLIFFIPFFFYISNENWTILRISTNGVHILNCYSLCPVNVVSQLLSYWWIKILSQLWEKIVWFFHTKKNPNSLFEVSWLVGFSFSNVSASLNLLMDDCPWKKVPLCWKL